MYSHWKLFREHVTSCSDPEKEMEVELVIRIDDNYIMENRIILFNQERERIYDSQNDNILFYGDGNLLIDYCLPRDEFYVISVFDGESDGFAQDGKVEIFIDRELVGTIEGDFGESVLFRIEDGNSGEFSITPAPTPPLEASESTPTPSSASDTSSPTAMPTKSPVRNTVFRTTAPTPFNSSEALPVSPFDRIDPELDLALTLVARQVRRLDLDLDKDGIVALLRVKVAASGLQGAAELENPSAPPTALPTTASPTAVPTKGTTPQPTTTSPTSVPAVSETVERNPTEITVDKKKTDPTSSSSSAALRLPHAAFGVFSLLLGGCMFGW